MTSDLYILNYCHPNCVPLRNIMRLPRDEAFALAHEMAAQNRETTAFYRFADFERYYPERMKTDFLLRRRFIELGGKPVQEHPLSFVLHGSDYLDAWFDHGTITRFPLDIIPAQSISFTLGDSMSALQREGTFTMLTKDMLLRIIADFDGPMDAFLSSVTRNYHYIEAQVWDDACLGL